LLLRYENLIFQICRRYFNNAEDAVDASQEAAIRIYKGLRTVKVPESGSLKGWVCAVTANICLDELRKRRVATEPLPEDGGARMGTEPSAEDSAFGRERAREIMAAIDKLPGHHRILIILRDMQGLTYQELSEAVHINEGTVKSRLSRARAALKEILK
jgi:RNA polymerase sigma-70 factor (ECF subfamily)